MPLYYLFSDVTPESFTELYPEVSFEPARPRSVWFIFSFYTPHTTRRRGLVCFCFHPNIQRKNLLLYTQTTPYIPVRSCANETFPGIAQLAWRSKKTKPHKTEPRHDLSSQMIFSLDLGSCCRTDGDVELEIAFGMLLWLWVHYSLVRIHVVVLVTGSKVVGR